MLADDIIEVEPRDSYLILVNGKHWSRIMRARAACRTKLEMPADTEAPFYRRLFALPRAISVASMYYLASIYLLWCRSCSFFRSTFMMSTPRYNICKFLRPSITLCTRAASVTVIRDEALRALTYWWADISDDCMKPVERILLQIRRVIPLTSIASIKGPRATIYNGMLLPSTIPFPFYAAAKYMLGITVKSAFGADIATLKYLVSAAFCTTSVDDGHLYVIFGRW